MRVVKILNNNFLLVENEFGHENIVMGKGLRFLNEVGSELNQNDVEKIFVSKNSSFAKEYIRLIEETPLKYMEVVQEIIYRANERLKGNLHDQIFMTLLDHIIYAIERYKNHIVLQNRLLWEVKKFYPKEYEIGLYSLNYLNEELDMELPDEEAGNIAFHLVNAQTDEMNMEQTMLVIRMIKDIFNILQYQLQMTIHKDSINYSRFLTHMQFFIQRILDDKMLNNHNEFLFDQIQENYQKEMECAYRVRDYVHKTLQIIITKEELMYLAIHIIRIIETK